MSLIGLLPPVKLANNSRECQEGLQLAASTHVMFHNLQVGTRLAKVMGDRVKTTLGP